MCRRRDFLKKMVILAAALSAPHALFAREKQDWPNIILFISDDHGWADSGAYGDDYIKTPNIDRLAKQGMRFDAAFAASPLCSPSRCVLQTGLMPHRNGGHKFGTPINRGIKTMAAYFNELGYETAHFGKFHTAPQGQFPYSHINKSRQTLPAKKFLLNYAGDRPLFLVICSYPPHTPWIKNTDYDPTRIKLPPNFVDTPETRSDRANYYSDVTLMDRFLGDVMEAVEKKGMNANTLFIYTSDQGANWPFAKWCVYDQGLRVPFIARWPGKIAPGSTNNAMISLADLLPTLIDATGGSAPKGLDGRSIVPVLLDQKAVHRRRVFGTHTGNDNGGPGIANHCPARTLRTPTHRYILNLDPETTFTTHITGCKTGPHYLPHWDSWVEKAKTDAQAKTLVERYQHRPSEELYDLLNDPFVMNNLAGNPEHRDLVRAFRKRLTEWCKTQGDDAAIAVLDRIGG